MEQKQRKIEESVQQQEERVQQQQAELRDSAREQESSVSHDTVEVSPPVSQQATSPVVAVEPVAPASLPETKSPRLLEVERILSDGLQDLYWSLTPPEQKVFREKGEEVAHKIEGLLNQTTLRIAKVIAYIKEWLRTIPHINRFFLEQEAKIKADKIRGLHGTSEKNK